MWRRFNALVLVGWLLLAAQASCVKQPRRANRDPGQSAPPAARAERASAIINLNTASREELEKLPGIGEALAARIVEHREKYGRFRRAEHLLMVRGISARRFAELRVVLTVE